MANYSDGHTITCGIIGNPVKHTMSPLIHNSFAQSLSENLVYVPFEVSGQGLESAVKGAYELGIRGINVTVPYKSDVIPFLNDIDPMAKKIGAVNTLVRDETLGGYKGYNTDATGLFHAMQDEGIELADKTVIILGAGGVARPVAHLCVEKGAACVFILNRTVEKAYAIAEEFTDGKVQAKSLSSYLDVLASLAPGEKFFAIQCTSVGLYPDVDSVVIDDPVFYKRMYAALDVIYRPLETKFLAMAKEAGAKTFSGLKMLLYQAVDAFELWFEDKGLKIDKDLADEVYLSLMHEVMGAKNITLVGFMGSGKTTVSELLAEALDMELVDTDEAITDSEKMTVNEIFAEFGEDGFRNMETELLDFFDAEHLRDTVISSGGGLPIREKNREYLKKLGKTVYLRTSAEAVYERLKDDDTRPLLKSEDPMARIKELLDSRKDIYEGCADIIVDTDGRTPVEIAEYIIKKIYE
ncbi:MAG: shikimate dehydrogenase [Butyrivibrio sp.]|nr:shikimate dehydrogenase [Butyrivibrio sp.]